MDAVEFLKEHDRMCNSFNDCCKDRESGIFFCEIHIKLNETRETCAEYCKNHPEEVVAIVEKWSKKHPRKTRQSELLKMFPKAKKDANNVITICPYETCISFECGVEWGESTEPKCRECRKKYWLEEVE